MATLTSKPLSQPIPAGSGLTPTLPKDKPVGDPAYKSPVRWEKSGNFSPGQTGRPLIGEHGLRRLLDISPQASLDELMESARAEIESLRDKLGLTPGKEETKPEPRIKKSNKDLIGAVS